MSTPNVIVTGMVAHLIGSSVGCHDDPTDIDRTYGMISQTSGHRSSRHSYLADNLICNRNSRRVNPNDSASIYGAGKPKTVYVGKNQCPVYIVQLAEVSDITWRKKAGFDLISSLLGSLSGGQSVSDLIKIVDK